MNIGPQQPSGGSSGQGGRRRRRRGRGGAPSRPGQQPSGSQHYGGGGGGGGGSRSGGGSSSRSGGGRSRAAFTGPMDHSYRNGGNGGGQNGGGGQQRTGRGRPQPVPKFFQHPDVEPLPVNQNAETKIYCFVDDLFFNAKIQEVARKLNVKVEFVKTDKELHEKLDSNGEGKPSLIIFDLNNANAKPLSTIPRLKKTLKKETTIIGFLSHLQAELKQKAQDAGCDMVLPRSAFSQNLPQLLRRHAVDDSDETVQ